MANFIDMILGRSQNPTLAESLLSRNIQGLPDADRFRTPGINPNAEPLPTAPTGQPSLGSRIGGGLNKLDNFIGSDGGSFLLNLLAQQGFSTTPGSKLGAIGRAGLATQQQKSQREQNKLRDDLLRARLKLQGESQDPAAVREFEFFEKLSEEEKKRYLAVKRAQTVRDVPGAGLGTINPLTGGLDSVVPEETIQEGLGGRAGAAEAAEQAAITGAIPDQARARSEVKRVLEAEADLPEVSDKTARVVEQGQEIIRQLESGELDTGFFRGQLPALTTNEQLFEVFSGDQVLEKISQATFGALSEGEREFLRTTVSSRTKTPEANIKIIKDKIALLQEAERRVRNRAGQENVIDFSELP